MPTMTQSDVQATVIFLSVALIVWCVYGSNHHENRYVPAINSFWIGAINFMILFYIFFSK